MAPDEQHLTAADVTVLDNPAWHALSGPQSNLAETVGRARRYPVDVSPFVGLPTDATASDWADLARLVGAGGTAVVTGETPAPPSTWQALGDVAGVQLTDAGVVGRPFAEAVTLGPDDVEEMLALVAQTQPGPFLARTVELGTYLGVRSEGRLVAMAGQRMHPPGWTEISAVCTDAAFRGQGLAGDLVRAVVLDIRERGERPMLHTAASNAGAIRLYEQLGFAVRRHTAFRGYRAPG